MLCYSLIVRLRSHVITFFVLLYDRRKQTSEYRMQRHDAIEPSTRTNHIIFYPIRNLLIDTLIAISKRTTGCSAGDMINFQPSLKWTKNHFVCQIITCILFEQDKCESNSVHSFLLKLDANLQCLNKIQIFYHLLL